MYHFFVQPENIGEKVIRITGEDVNHIKNVLRMKPGEEVRLCTGLDNKDYRCEIESLSDEEVTARIMWVETGGTELASKIWLFQSLPKSDKMETIVQKAVELGAYRIVPVESKRSVVKLEGSRAQNKVRRWNAISESAASQAKRMIIPEVTEPVSFQRAARMASSLDKVLIPYELAEDMDHTRRVMGQIRPGQSVGIFIGPEGGFEEQEVLLAESIGAERITLGRRILRTETAGMTVLSILMYLLEENADAGRTSLSAAKPETGKTGQQRERQNSSAAGGSRSAVNSGESGV